jgi:hypothetical protein
LSPKAAKALVVAVALHGDAWAAAGMPKSSSATPAKIAAIVPRSGLGRIT